MPSLRHPANARKPLFFVVAALLLGLALSATPAGAQGNSGTIKVHDGPTASPSTRNEPHVSGDFYIEGMNMAAEEGTLQVFSWPPTGDRTLVLDTTWTADGGEPANHFRAGPFFLPCGHYRVEAQNGLEEDDFPGGTKSKMFWIDGCEEPEPTPSPTPSPSSSPSPSPSPGPEPEPSALACPTGLRATANPDETVTLTWTPAPGSDGSNVYRAAGGDDLEYVATVDGGTWTDTTTTAGNGYAYSVTALFGEEESTDCPLAEVTAIPVFPSLVAGGLAVGLGLLAYVGWSRRQA